MSVAGVNGTTTAYAAAYENTAKTENKAAQEKKETEQKTTGAVYEKSSDSNNKASYDVKKMNAEQRAELVKQLKEDQANRQSQLVDIVNKMLNGQATKFTQANDDMWRMLAKGNFTVDAETKAKAQQDIAEDGYYGVKQTSQRIFDFAYALAGDDEEKMKEMQDAVKKGFKQAAKSWGGDLPSISNDTYDAVEKLFNDYYDSKKVITEE